MQTSNIDYSVGYTAPLGAAFPSSQIAGVTFGGAAAGDCDGDSDIDLFITYGDWDGNKPGGPNRLYLNQLVESGDGLQFVDTADAAGVANTRSDGRGNDRHSGPIFADMDGDGDLDLFVGGLFGDPSKIYENQGNCTFVDVTADSPGIVAMSARRLDSNPTPGVQTMSAAFGDYDLDGDLDMFLTHWGTLDSLYLPPHDTETDHLWRNDFVETGVLRFVNVSEETNVSTIAFQTRAWGANGEQNADFTFTPTFARVNDDVWPDILIAGDFGTSELMLNNGDGTFRSGTDIDFRAAQFGMGSAVTDYDFDGDLDWFVTSIFNPDAVGGVPTWGNRLFRNRVDESARFDDITDGRGVDDGQWGWGTCALDIDNDGDLDIFQTNGWSIDDPRLHNHDFTHDKSRLFVSLDIGIYEDRAAEMGLDDDRDARGVVCADFDHDGDMDLLVLTDAKPNSALLWRNDNAAAGNNSLRIRLNGLSPNTEAAGARIYVTVNGRQQMREVIIGGNYTAQNPTVQVFGLAAATAIDEIRVEWPAVVPGPGMDPKQAVTTLNAGDPRLRPTAPGETLVLDHPDP
jgi:hypothetical protein